MEFLKKIFLAARGCGEASKGCLIASIIFAGIGLALSLFHDYRISKMF